MVPVSDSLLDLLSGEWSEPVQLKAIPRPGGDAWDIVLRPAEPTA